MKETPQEPAPSHTGLRWTGTVATLITGVFTVFWFTALRLANCNWGFFGDFSPRAGSRTFDGSDVTFTFISALIVISPTLLTALFTRHVAQQKILTAITAAALAVILIATFGYAFDSASYWQQRCGR